MNNMAEGILSEMRRLREKAKVEKFLKEPYGNLGITVGEALEMELIDDVQLAVMMQPPAPPEPVREPTPEEAKKLMDMMERRGRRPGYNEPQETTEE